MRLTDLKDKNVVIWGAGIEGEEAAQAAIKAGAHVSVAVDGPAKDSSPKMTSTTNLPIAYGDQGVAALKAAQVIIRSPGIPPHNPLFKALQDKMTTSTELWLADCADRTIAITGSKGKSTTSSLLAHIMKKLGLDVELGGNIGIPLLSLPPNHQWYVAELSSYQTMTLKQSPKIAVLTALFPEHLDYHGTLEEYYAAKLNLVSHNPQIVIASSENQELKDRLPKTILKEKIVWVPAEDITVTQQGVSCNGQLIINAANTPLPGRHNLHNASLCLGVLQQIGVDIVARRQDISKAIQSFVPLKHRLQVVGVVDGKLWVNDSISTTPESSIAALEAYPNVPTTIIMGGDDRGLSFDILKKYLQQRENPVSVVAVPDTGARIAEVLKDIPKHKVYASTNILAAVKKANQITPNGGVVLLSPAAASYKYFKNFEDRGDTFIAAVQAL